MCENTERDVAERSLLIKNMLEDLGGANEEIPIPNVSYPFEVKWPLVTIANHTRNTGQRSCLEEGHRMVQTSQERPPQHWRGG